MTIHPPDEYRKALVAEVCSQVSDQHTRVNQRADFRAILALPDGYQPEAIHHPDLQRTQQPETTGGRRQLWYDRW